MMRPIRQVFCAFIFLPLILIQSTSGLLNGINGIEDQDDTGSDLSFYVSRPDIRAPKLAVKTYDIDALTPGYIFTEPYYSLRPKPKEKGYEPFQTGPHIYDNQGELVWSSAELTTNLVALDFRPIVVNGSFHMSFALKGVPGTPIASRMYGYILNSSYDVVEKTDLTNHFDMHEFLPINDATSFLRVLSKRATTDQVIKGEKITVLDACATELDGRGSEIFSFCALSQIDPDETFCHRPPDASLKLNPWDLYHMNSVAKFPNGDFLTSLRYTNAIYRISHATGKILWRLGGKFSDFQQDFNFSAQHDARIVSTNETVTIMSFLDNAMANDCKYTPSANVSSFKLVALYEKETPKRAKLLRQYNRPDGELTQLRGNGQYYPSGGAFVAWSWQSYISEFAPDGSVVQEARFTSTRFNSYRTYKADFVGKPNTLPDLVTFASPSSGQLSSISYVSWNGATEVSAWDFYGSNNREGEYKRLGRTPRTGFETAFIYSGAWRYVQARAVDKEENVLGESSAAETACHACSTDTTGPLRVSSNFASAKVEGYGLSKTLIYGLSIIGFALGVLMLVIIFRRTGVISRSPVDYLYELSGKQQRYLPVSQGKSEEG